jgi:hypothetical protein
MFVPTLAVDFQASRKGCEKPAGSGPEVTRGYHRDNIAWIYRYRLALTDSPAIAYDGEFVGTKSKLVSDVHLSPGMASNV